MWLLFSNLFSPKKFFYLSTQVMPWLSVVFVVSFAYGLIAGLYLVPADYLQGEAFRIIYIHVPCAFLSLFVYAVMAGTALLGIIFQLRIAFLIMKHSAMIGASFTLLALITGSIWGKPMWGTWWTWDARLTSELVLFFLYTGIILFQSAVANKKNGLHLVAILVLLGFIDIPIIHYSVYWWNTLHQGATFKFFAPSNMDSSMVAPLISMFIALMAYYFIVIILRLRYELTANFNHHWLIENYG